MAKITCASPELTAKVLKYLSLKNEEVKANRFRKKKLKKEIDLLSAEIECLVKEESYA